MVAEIYPFLKPRTLICLALDDANSLSYAIKIQPPRTLATLHPFFSSTEAASVLGTAAKHNGDYLAPVDPNHTLSPRM